MSMELMDEHEQGERVRAWLRENGASILTGIALGIAGIVGWQWWGNSQATHRAAASAQYLALGKAIEANDRDGQQAIMASLRGEFAKTPYAILGAFDMADQQLLGGETQAAVQTLRDALAAVENPALKALGEARLARALIAAGDAEGALTVIGDAERGSEHELRGDALRALGRKEDAVAAYRKALETYADGIPTRRMVEMKLLDLGVKNAAVEA
jgi:predicted negative regulator of RcsB-dependent stress response